MARHARLRTLVEAVRSDRWSSPRALVAELRRRNPPLFAVAALNAALFAAFAAGVPLDPRTVAGDPVWLKPAKFAGAIALVTATLGWLSKHLPVAASRVRRASHGIAAGLVLEILLIGGQAARGVGSHFNDATALDTAVGAVMGVTILGVVGLVALLLVRSRGRDFGVHPAFQLGILLGGALFVVGSLEGGAMLAIGGRATAPGPTVPVLGWSLGGDFRLAHFVGLHALQLLPLTGYLAGAASEAGLLRRPKRVVAAVAAAFLAALGHALVPLVG
ncbi:hypothetical protein [Halostella litorea]|uniref:hypothetical protein n=1 Tax=Halostella litorea TaxID=2528831 RepID=UPI00192A35F3|nr:hypothetical protein [Halostella litorea]